MLKKKVVHIVGNRPQFIKLAPVSVQLRERGAEELIIHTGQHYDANMSDIFFEELGIPKPYINLGIGSASHAEMTAKALCGLERDLEKISPDIALIYGDTDSTLAGALAASKLNIPLAHIEAGERTFNKTNPEEKNRITDCFFSNLEKLHLGQALDISWHRDSGFYPAEKEYLLMVSLKTGTLANMAGELGAIAGKQEERTVSECGAAFRMAGMGFQIIDDVINLKTGNPGKLRGDDIVEGKKSLPVILYANLHKGTEKLTEIFKTAGKEGITSGAVEEGIKLLSGSGAIDKALEKGKTLIYESMEKIGRIFPPGEAKDGVIAMLEKMIPQNL